MTSRNFRQFWTPLPPLIVTFLSSRPLFCRHKTLNPLPPKTVIYERSLFRFRSKYRANNEEIRCDPLSLLTMISNHVIWSSIVTAWFDNNIWTNTTQPEIFMREKSKLHRFQICSEINGTENWLIHTRPKANICKARNSE